MANRRRYHSISLKLTDEELQLWNTKHEASGLNKTDYLMQAIRNSEVRVYSIEESIAPIVHEIRRSARTSISLHTSQTSDRNIVSVRRSKRYARPITELWGSSPIF